MLHSQLKMAGSRVRPTVVGLHFLTSSHFGSPLSLIWSESLRGKVGKESATGTVAFVRPSASHESNGINLNDQVRVHEDYIWKIVRAKLLS
jgi:hypothetical protein